MKRLSGMSLPVLLLGLTPALVPGMELTPQQGAAGDSLKAVVTGPSSRTRVTALAFLLPVGSGADPEGSEGAHWLIARALELDLQQALAPMSATARAEVSRAWTRFDLLATEDTWRTAVPLLDRLLFDIGPSAASLRTVIEAAAEQHAFADGAPIRAFQREAERVLHGRDHPWSRPIAGYASTVATLTPERLRALHRDGYEREETVAGASGGPFVNEVAESLRAKRRHTASGTGTGTVSRNPSWTVGDRVDQIREVASSWLAVAFPVGRGPSLTQLDFLRFALRERLNPFPRNPELYEESVEIVDTPQDGLALVVTVAVPPGRALAWEARILEEVAALRTSRPDPEFLSPVRRRFRADAMLRDAQPEALVARLVTDLLRAGSPRDLAGESWTLSSEDLRSAAASLGPPRILVFGPDLSDEGEEQRGDPIRLDTDAERP